MCASTNSEPLPTAQTPRKRRKGWWWKLPLLLLAFFAVWLFWPQSLPEGILLDRMPGDLTAGIEIRSPATFWRTLLASPAWTQLRQTPLGDQQAKIDATLNKVWGLAGRSLNGAWAFAAKQKNPQPPPNEMTNTNPNSAPSKHNLDGVLLGTIDNAAMLLLRLHLWQSGKTGEGVSQRFIIVEVGTGERLYLTVAAGMVVAAFSPERLQSTIVHLESGDVATPRVADSTTTLPRASILVRNTVGSSLLPWLEAEKKLSPASTVEGTAPKRETLSSLACVISLSSEQVRVRLSGEVLPVQLEPYWTADTRARKSSSAASAPKNFQLAADTKLWVRGTVRENIFWQALCHRVWGEAARPRRGASQPIGILAWEMFNNGVIRYADGRVAIGVAPPAAVKTAAAIPSLPRLDIHWGVTDGQAARTDFRRGIQAVVAYYHAPGGNKLYEDVRKVTKLLPAADGSTQIKLHPLFFNHLAPGWQIFSQSGVFSTQWSAYAATVLKPKKKAADSEATAPEDGQLADLFFGWDKDEKVLAAIRAVAVHKIVDHAYVADPKKQRQVMQTVTALLLPFARVVKSRGRLRLHRRTDADGEISYPFSINLSLTPVKMPAP